jgi:hypothetical protein
MHRQAWFTAPRGNVSRGNFHLTKISPGLTAFGVFPCIHPRTAVTTQRRILIMTDYRVAPGEAQEDQVTAAIERVTSQVPSTVFLGAAIASIVASVIFKAVKKDHEALFVGQWVAPFLILGLYNKMVKQNGSDATSQRKSYS